jgi:hypothetical protein
LGDGRNRWRRATQGEPSAAITLLRPPPDRRRGGNRLRSLAEDLFEVPARRQVERQFETGRSLDEASIGSFHSNMIFFQQLAFISYQHLRTGVLRLR